MTEQNVKQMETDEKVGKYLTFALAHEVYGLDILKVREVIGMMDIAHVPNTPEFVKGVINLRGKIVPVVDLRLKLAMPSADCTGATCIIVVSLEDTEIGLIVDQVLDVLSFSTGEMEPMPSLGTDVNTEFFQGVAKSHDKIVILLDINGVFAGDEIASLPNN